MRGSDFDHGVTTRSRRKFELRIANSELRMTAWDIYERTFDFACRVVRLHRATRRSSGANGLLNQLLRAATSIGANLAEAKGAQSRADFISKVRIALKEARESHYWLRLLTACELIPRKRVEPLTKEADEIVAILTAIVVNTAAHHKSTS